jgi:hypothetical protein
MSAKVKARVKFENFPGCIFFAELSSRIWNVDEINVYICIDLEKSKGWKVVVLDLEPINIATLTCALRRSDINIHSDPFLYDFPLLKLNTQQKPPDEFVYLVH